MQIGALALIALTLSTPPTHAAPPSRHIAVENGEALEFIRTVPRDVDLAGLPGQAASNTARGFVGVAFRSAPRAAAFDCFYLRPTNGRADDQLRRNHATQYVSEPDYPWERLRTQSPGVYESYVDLETGAWTHVRIEVSGVRARLFVNGAAQPALIMNDLKRGVTTGAIGLWLGPGTEAYFRNLQVTLP